MPSIDFMSGPSMQVAILLRNMKMGKYTVSKEIQKVRGSFLCDRAGISFSRLMDTCAVLFYWTNILVDMYAAPQELFTRKIPFVMYGGAKTYGGKGMVTVAMCSRWAR